MREQEVGHLYLLVRAVGGGSPPLYLSQIMIVFLRKSNMLFKIKIQRPVFLLSDLCVMMGEKFTKKWSKKRPNKGRLGVPYVPDTSFEYPLSGNAKERSGPHRNWNWKEE